MNGSDEFYIGYAATAPARTARWIRRAVVAALCGAAGISVVLVCQQRPFAAAFFDYGQSRTISGVVRERPLPHAELAGGQRALLVAPGKHGAAELIRGFDGERLDFSATRIQRDGNLMLEVLPGSLRVMPGEPDREPKWTGAGPVDLRGEIVDTKCYLGVMNPSEGKVHRDCAARCISGGIPPALIARDANGRAKLLPITGPAGVPINKQLLPFVAEPVVVRGALFRSGDLLRIEVWPSDIRRAE